MNKWDCMHSNISKQVLRQIFVNFFFDDNRNPNISYQRQEDRKRGYDRKEEIYFLSIKNLCLNFLVQKQ